MKYFLVLIGFFIVFVAIAGCTSSSQITQQKQMTTQQIIAQANTYGYDYISRNPEAATGKIVELTGKIVQVQSSGSGYEMRVATSDPSSYGYYVDDVYYVSYDGSRGRFIEGDFVKIYGSVKGLKTYKAILGNDLTIPWVEVLLIASDDKPTPVPTLDPALNLKVSNVKLVTTGKYVQHLVFSGNAENIGDQTIKSAQIVGKFYTGQHSDGAVVGSSTDYISNLAPGETWSWEMTYYGDVDKVQSAHADVGSVYLK